jgi:hypothetical protein
VIRKNFPQFRLCYERGWIKNRHLKGRITVRFVIDHSGKVARTAVHGDLPDRGVVDCVARNLDALSFPPPDGGPVAVVYPIQFCPGPGE